MKRLALLLLLWLPAFAGAEPLRIIEYRERSDCPGGQCPPQAPRQRERGPRVAPETIAASVLVRVAAVGSGSGTVVSVGDDYAAVLTCRHVSGELGRSGQIIVTFTRPLGEEQLANFGGRLVAVDHVADLALIVIQAKPGMPVAHVADAAPAVGSGVGQAGYPRGRGPIDRAGWILGLTEPGYTHQQRSRSLRLSFLVDLGDSGSGVFDPGGRLVGVIWGVSMDESYAVAHADVARFLSSPACLPWLRQRRPPAPQQPPAPVPPQQPQPPAPAQPDPRIGELGSRIDRITDLIGELGRGLRQIQDHAEGIGERSDGRLIRLEDWASWLPLIAGGAATGGAVPLFWLGLQIWRLARPRLRAAARTQSQVSTRAEPEESPPSRLENIVNVETRNDAPETKYVKVDGPCRACKARNMADDEVVKKYPAALDTIEMSQAYAKQILSGGKV